ncbi:hypothetical protein TL16_g12191 [Triparma laevis f. inornata]|uniref:O-phosphoseryl-tRNA(Sec) selenium transferase n=1 Tax=Triparma laevis f. inornata TaxID=1714386 RepID=A0A9W7EU77_9STRA|nr:hypothetical protein TL16_g12191 [Triparma laevis f. inornata]
MPKQDLYSVLVGSNDKSTVSEIPTNHLRVGLSSHSSLLSHLLRTLSNRTLPPPLPPTQILTLLSLLTSLDTQNHPLNIGCGEREARLASSILKVRGGLIHGIGRSGDVNEMQPKAAGSSVICVVVKIGVKDILQNSLNFDFLKKSTVTVLPTCTGLTLLLCLLTLKKSSKKSSNKVLWCRIDQKSCVKSIQSGGFELIIVPTLKIGDAVTTDIDALKALLDTHGDDVLCCITTTSCFAPRIPDDIISISKILKSKNVGHIINNAYGLQSSHVNSMMVGAVNKGRVDYVVSSLDKNFCVPVGGAIVFGPDKTKVKELGKMYPGRANGRVVEDMFISLLEVGREGYEELWEYRRNLIPKFIKTFENVATENGERMLKTEGNDIR